MDTAFNCGREKDGEGSRKAGNEHHEPGPPTELDMLVVEIRIPSDNGIVELIVRGLSGRLGYLFHMLDIFFVRGRLHGGHGRRYSVKIQVQPSAIVQRGFEYQDMGGVERETKLVLGLT